MWYKGACKRVHVANIKKNSILFHRLFIANYKLHPIIYLSLHRWRYPEWHQLLLFTRRMTSFLRELQGRLWAVPWHSYYTHSDYWQLYIVSFLLPTKAQVKVRSSTGTESLCRCRFPSNIKRYRARYPLQQHILSLELNLYAVLDSVNAMRPSFSYSYPCLFLVCSPGVQPPAVPSA